MGLKEGEGDKAGLALARRWWLWPCREWIRVSCAIVPVGSKLDLRQPANLCEGTGLR